jgi:hypothetical protein
MSILHIWDFDDTLAYSESIVSQLVEDDPETPKWMWWHDITKSVDAALKTPPIVEQWERIGNTPVWDVHMILTGRNREAVLAWLAKHRDDERIGRAVRRIGTRVISTSAYVLKDFPTYKKKAGVLRSIAASSHHDEIRFIDDKQENIEAAAAIGVDNLEVELFAAPTK